MYHVSSRILKETYLYFVVSERNGRILYGAHGNFCWAIAGSVQIINLMREAHLNSQEAMEQDRPTLFQMLSNLAQNHPLEPIQVKEIRLQG